MSLTRAPDDALVYELYTRGYVPQWVRARRPRVPRPRVGAASGWVDPTPGVPNVRPEAVAYWQRIIPGAYAGMPITPQMRELEERTKRTGGKGKPVTRTWPEGTPGGLGGRGAEDGPALIGQVTEAFRHTKTPEERAKILSLLDDKQFVQVAKRVGVKLPKGIDRLEARRKVAAEYDPDTVPRRDADIPAGTKAADALEQIRDDPQDPKAAPRQRWEVLRGLSVAELREVAEQVGVKVPRHPLAQLREQYGDWDSDPEVLDRMDAAGLETLAMQLGVPLENDPDKAMTSRQVRELRQRLAETLKSRPDAGRDAEFDQEALARFIAGKYERPPKPKAPRKPPPTPEERREALDALREQRGDWAQDPSVLDGMKRDDLRLVAEELGVRPYSREKAGAFRERLKRVVEHRQKTGFKPGGWEEVDPATLRAEAVEKVRAALDRRGDKKSKAYKQAERQLMRLVDELFPEEPSTEDLVLRNGTYTVTVRGGTRDVDTAELTGRLERLITDNPQVGPVSAVVIPDRRITRYEGQGVLGYVQPAASDADIHAMVLSDALWTRAGQKQKPGHFMGSSRKASRAEYVTAHEFGHLLEPPDAPDVPPELKGMSRYGRTNEHEGFAEAFAEWHLSGGRTRSGAASWYAEEFEWPGYEPEPEPAPKPAKKAAPRKAAKKAAPPPLAEPAREMAADGTPAKRAPKKASASASPAFDELLARARTDSEALEAAPVGLLGRVGSAREQFRGMEEAFPDAEQRRSVGQALVAYRGPMFTGVNSFLRGTLFGPGPVSNGRTVGDIADLLRQAFSRSRLREPVVVWRGVKSGESLFGPRESWPDDLTGAEWTATGLLSTSTSQRTARKFGRRPDVHALGERKSIVPGEGGLLLRFVMPDGTPALQLSGSGSESELLFPDGLRFRVVRDRPGRGAVARILDVELVPTEGAQP